MQIFSKEIKSQSRFKIMAKETPKRQLLPLLIRNLIFTILQPGLVAVLIPYLIVNYSGKNTSESSLLLLYYAGVLIFAFGSLIVLFCIGQLAIQGAGTLSPIDPTEKLVTSGLYRFSRNPMYIGVLMMLVGENIQTGNVYLWLYSGLVFLIFYLFARYREEPRLCRDFGKDYDNYRQRVRRWL